MPINISVPFRLTPEETGATGYGEAFHQGLLNFGKEQESINTPKKLAADLLSQQLKNKYYGQDIESQIGLRGAQAGLAQAQTENAPYQRRLYEAQTQRALQPPTPVMGDFEKAVQGAKRIKDEYGENSEQYQTAQRNLQRIANGSRGSGAMLTNAVKTLNQNIVNGVPKVNEAIDRIIKAPSPTVLFGSSIYRPAALAAHNALVNEAVDSYVKAKGWPNTNESLDKARKILERGDFESDAAYRKRLEDTKKINSEEAKQAQKVLDAGFVQTDESLTTEQKIQKFNQNITNEEEKLSVQELQDLMKKYKKSEDEILDMLSQPGGYNG